MMAAAWRAQEGVPGNMTFKLGLGELCQGQGWGWRELPAQGTAWAKVHGREGKSRDREH